MRPSKQPTTSRAERLFGALVRLLPRDFRDEFEDQMRLVFRADHAESLIAGRRPGMRIRFWARMVTGILRTAPREHFDSLQMDLRFALRTLAKRPLFTAIAALSLAVGIGATTTVLAVFAATFGRTIPGIEEPQRLVNVKPWSPIAEAHELISYPNYEDLRDGNQVLEDLAGFHGSRLSWLGDGEPELVPAQFVTENYFSVLKVHPRLGRFFTPDTPDDNRTPQANVVISSFLWHRRFASDRSVVGQELRLNGSRFTVIGVTPEGFRGHFVGFNFDLFLPTSMAEIAGLPPREDRGSPWVELIGRLRPGVAQTQAQADFDLHARHLAEAFPEINRGLEIHLEPNTGIDADLRGGLWVFLVSLLGVSALVLLIACANVGNMMLGRTVSRSREIAVRLALGAPRSRLTRQLLTESLVLALIAGTVGTGLALGAARLVRVAVPALGGAVDLDVRIDSRVLLLALAVSLGSAFVFGLAPALRAARADLAAALKASVYGMTPRPWLRGAMVVGQVVLSLVVLTSAGLFLRALQRAGSIDPGLDPQGVYTAVLDPTLTAMEEEASAAFFAQVLERVSAAPGIEVAGLASGIPLSLGARFFPNPVTVGIPGWEPPQGQDGFAIEHRAVSPGYLETLRIAVVEGRGLEPTDDENGPPVAVINQTLAHRFFATSSPLGQTLRLADKEIEIVGVARDSRYRSLDEEPLPFLYLSFAQSQPQRGALFVRSTAGAGATSATLRESISELAPHLPVAELGPLAETLAVSLVPQRVAGVVSGALGLVGLFLTAVGLYGVLAYSVTQRAKEIGLRMSLGASPHQVLRLVLARGLLISLVGISIGIFLAAGVTHLFTVFLVGLSPLDLVTYVAVATLLVAMALLSSYFPARRASRVDPLTALRQD